MSEKTNQERIKKYLVGYEKDGEHKKGYLENELSNGKVIMLSGKWGSGKTHFWQNEIATDILKEELKEKREVYTYVSLYGKSSIEEIENDIFSQAYSSAIGGDNFITKGFATFTKRMKRFGSSKIANGLKDEQKDNIERTALSRLNNGGIICFDDFERKSKDIDLNDLFGFITQLTLNFQCKVVIILNDDVFEGEEKDIFSNVKEKSVSKFLKYEPSIEELFNSIFDNKDIYINLHEHKEIILETIKKADILNARIYFQVLDNLLEWIDNKQGINDNILRCLLLVNINFILYHTIVDRRLLEVGNYKYYLEEKSIQLFGCFQKTENFDKYKDRYKVLVHNRKDNSDEKNKFDIKSFDENLILHKSLHFSNKLDIGNNINDEIYRKINNFIETGILIDE